jgi:hypothetical protein
VTAARNAFLSKILQFLLPPAPRSSLFGIVVRLMKEKTEETAYTNWREGMKMRTHSDIQVCLGR